MNASRPPSEGFDPLRVLRGSLLAKVSGRLVTENGSGRFELESAELGGIPLPRALVSQLVSHYDVDLDAPFDLPSSIREYPRRARTGDRPAVTQTDPLQAPLGALPGVGPTRGAALASAGLRTIEDLLLRFPLRYEDRGHIQAIATLRPGTATIAGEVLDAQVRPTRRPRFTVFELTVGDATGTARAVFFNQRFLAQVFRPGQKVVLHGKVEWTSQGAQFQTPQYELADVAAVEDGDSVHTGRIVPVYERIGPLTPKLQRDLVARALERLPETITDPLPATVCRARGLPSRREALLDTHFPPEGTSVETLNAFRTPAQARLILEEFVLFQLALAEQRARVVSTPKPHRVEVSDATRGLARKVLPFTLTSGQRQALKEIVEDLQRPTAMNRLLQGDVGAGKTIVALLAAVVAMANGLQVVLMAPTELLAEQHCADGGRTAGGHAVPVGAPDRKRAQRGAPAGSGSDRRRRSRAGRGHARRARGPDALQAARPRDHRRAASLRRGPAGPPAPQGSPSGRARDDGDADSADADADGVRRPRCVGDPRPAAGAQAGADDSPSGNPPRGRVRLRARAGGRGPPGVRRATRHRGQRQDRRARRRVAWPTTLRTRRPRRPSAGAPARQAEGRRQAGRSCGASCARRSRRAGHDDGHRGGRGCAQRERDGDRARRAVRPVATAPAARACRARGVTELLRAAVRATSERRGAGAAERR